MQHTRRRILMVLAVAISGTAAACGGDSTGTVSVLPAALVGTWNANTSCSPACGYILTSISNPNANLDLVATGTLTISLVLHADGNASLNLSGAADNGTASVSGNTLYLASGGTTDTIDYTVSATSLDLQFRAPVTLDFNNDGIADPAHAHAILRKQ